MKCFLHQTLLERTYLATQVDIRDVGLIPRLGRSPGGGHGNLLHYPCLENPMNREAQWWLQSWAWNTYQYPTDDGSLLGGLQSLESLRVGPGWVTNHTHTHTQLRTIMGKFRIKTWIGFKWLFLIYIKKNCNQMTLNLGLYEFWQKPGKPHGLRSLVGYCPKNCTESDMTEIISTTR